MTRIPKGGSAAAIAAMPKRACPACGKTLKRKTRANGKPETVAQFAARQTCGGKCKGVAVARTLTTTKVTPQQWRAVDWTRSSTAIAADLGVTAQRVGQMRKRYAPSDQRDPPADLGQRLAAATRAFTTTRAALETAVDQRDTAIRERDELQHRLDAARAIPIPDPAQLRTAKRDLEKERARADQAEAARDQALADLQRARDDLTTTGTTDTTTAAAERDVALAELDRIKASRTVRPEILAALHRATSDHPELPDFITGTAPTDAWFPSANLPGPGTGKPKGKRV